MLFGLSHRRFSGSHVAAALALSAGIAAAPTSAQVFEWIHGTSFRDTAEGLRHTEDNGLISIGNVLFPQLPQRLHVIKYKDGGNVDWNVLWGGVGADQGYSVKQTRAGTYINAGRTQSSAPNLGLGLLHLDPTGGVLFPRVYFGDSAFTDRVNFNNTPSVSVEHVDTATGNIDFVVATSIAQAFGPNFPGQFGQLLRTNFNGSPIFNSVYLEPQQENNSLVSFTDVRYDRPNDDFVISGSIARRFQPTPGGPVITRTSLLFVRTDGAGNVLFAATYSLPPNPTGGPSNVWGSAIDIAENGDIILAGQTDAFQNNQRGAVVLRVNPGGATLWARTIKDFDPHFRTVHVNKDRTIGLGGTQFIPSPGAGPLALITFSPAGVPDFRRVYGPPTPPDAGKALAPLLTGNACGWALIGEKSSAAAGNQDLILARTDPQGRTGCFEQRVDPAVQQVDMPPNQIALVRTFVQGTEIWPGQAISLDILENNLCRGFKACPGDANGDGVVNFADITAVLASFGSTYPLSCIGLGDANGDGVVNFADNTIVLANFGNTCP